MRYPAWSAFASAAFLVLWLMGCDGATVSGAEDTTTEADVQVPSIEDTVDVQVTPDVEPKVDFVAPDLAPDLAVDIPEDVGVDLGGPDVPPAECEEGEPCDDGDPCTQGDLCVAGRCVGEPYSCVDELDCTADQCDGEGGCRFLLRGGHCLIDGICRADGEASPDNPCQACVAPLSTEQWSAGPAVACDDGDACTVGDLCRQGLCVGAARDCGEAAACRAWRCDPVEGCVEELLSEVACDDGDPCTLGDTCVAGDCVAGQGAPFCDDGNVCTDDSCDPVTGRCLHVPNTLLCDDGDACTRVDRCEQGLCVGSSPLDCDDGNDCTDDGCHPLQGCLHVNNSDPCEDGDPCSVGDRCVVGACTAGPGRLDCGGDNPCLDYLCLAGMGCVELPNDNLCSDDNACTLGDRCQGGSCQPGEGTLDCADGRLCTDDLCDPAVGCVWENNTESCDDGDPCTVGDVCGGGSCQPGDEALACPSDGDPCTFNRCQAGVGCVAEPLSGPVCDDRDPCTVGDACVEGLCEPGPDELDCTDEDECTANYCDPGEGCVVEPLTGTLCDDGSVCTLDDRCMDGRCVGDALDCDDLNLCTLDSCHPVDGCLHEPAGTVNCWPTVYVWNPPRGATIAGSDGLVTVSGLVESYPRGEISVFRINGEDVALEPDGMFSVEMEASHGLNMIRAYAEDDLGITRDVRQSFQYSEAYWPMDPANPEAARIDDGIVVFLADEVIDDGDRSDVDDLATIFEIMFAGIDLNTMIPNPAAVERVDLFICTCNYTIRVFNVQHDPPSIQLIPLNDALRLILRMDDFSADATARASGWCCPSLNVDITADRVTVDATTQVLMTDGQITADVTSRDVTFQNLRFSDSNWFVDLIIGLFEGTIEDEIESAFEDAIEDMVPDLLTDVFGALALSEAFEIPAFLPGQQPATLTLDSTISDLDIKPDGILLGLAPVVMAAEHLSPYTPLGAIARDTCLTGVPPSFTMARDHAIDVAIFDDLLNEVLYSVFMAGVLEMTVDDETLGQDLSGYGISSLLLDLSFMLPPIVEWCDEVAGMQVQIGDIRIDADLTLLGSPIQVTMFASLAAQGSIDLVEGDGGGLELGITVGELLYLDVEIADISSGFEGLVPTLRGLIEDELVPSLLEGMLGESLGSFPIPEIDLSGIDPAIPPGTVLAIDPQEIWRDSGYTLIGGNIATQ